MHFTIEPTAVPFSTDETASFVDFALTMTNEKPVPVSCGSVILTFPHGDPTATLTDDPSTITTAPGDATPWAISTDGSGIVQALPLPPATGLAPGESATFTLGSVLINTSPGSGRIDITAMIEGAPFDGRVEVKKDRPAKPGEGQPIIRRFAVTPEFVGLGGKAVVSWEVVGATTSVLEPGPVPLPTPADGQLPVQVWDTTIYRLIALGQGGTARARSVCTVMPVEINEFVASPLGPVIPGVAVTLRWSTRYTDTCSIDQGVGPVPGSGSVVVAPSQTTVYTFTAAGLQGRNKSVTVTVSP